MELIQLHKVLQLIKYPDLNTLSSSNKDIVFAEMTHAINEHLKYLLQIYKVTITFEGLNLFVNGIQVINTTNRIAIIPILQLPFTPLAKSLNNRGMHILYSNGNDHYGYDQRNNVFFYIKDTGEEVGELDLMTSSLPLNFSNFPIKHYANFLALRSLLTDGIELLTFK